MASLVWRARLEDLIPETREIASDHARARGAYRFRDTVTDVTFAVGAMSAVLQESKLAKTPICPTADSGGRLTCPALTSGRGHCVGAFGILISRSYSRSSAGVMV